MIFGIRKVSSREPKIIKTRQLKHYDAQKFREDLRKVDWESIFEHEDVNIMSLEWEQKFLSILYQIGMPHIVKERSRTHTRLILIKILRHKMFLRDFLKKNENTDDKTSQNSEMKLTL